jgi:hypothetical protein
MPDVMTTSREIQDKLVRVKLRNEEKLQGIKTLPKVVRDHMDTQIFADMQFLLSYITALHAILEEVSQKTATEEFKFE